MSEQSLDDALWEAVAAVRDASPRLSTDADTWDIVAAVRRAASEHFMHEADRAPSATARTLALYVAGRMA